ncbi:MAG: cobyrinate a,c-diamide synthase [Methanoregula sp.]|nr:MAG: cobyrinate a,c-diamide synthase [Methanoregula sp.]
MIKIPRIVIAGTHSGCGKTTVATGVMAALVARGLQVQPFKVGPDFIDPTHHTKICGRTSRNLDPFMMGEEGIQDTFLRATAGADIAVIEGVMGLYDGIDGTERSSTAHVASILDAPVVLVVDAKGMSRSAQALIHGFSTFHPSLSIAGVIFNRIGSDRHRQMIASSLSVPAFGWIPIKEQIVLKSRHLGLEMAHETGARSEIGTVISENCDLDAMLKTARDAPPFFDEPRKIKNRSPLVKIGVAWDPAFCFYYMDNLDRLRFAGADLVFFSPLCDKLPDVQGLYIGGGYPELHLSGLSSSPCRLDIRKAADAGMPIYGECGGLMYLTDEIVSDQTYPLCGALSATTEMTKKLQALGYVQGESIGGRSFLKPGLPLFGHEFHYSKIVAQPDARYAFRLVRGKGIADGNDGLVNNNTIGTYTHAYFSGVFIKNLLDNMKKWETA